MKSRAPLLAFLFLFILNSPFSANGQSFMNGNFEITTAPGDQVNMINSSFNSMMSNTFAYGNWSGGGPGGGNMDIIRTTTYGLGPQSGLWYVAQTGGGTDAITMQLTSALSSGSTYTINWYDNAWSTFFGPPAVIGVSSAVGTTGTIVYTGTYTVSSANWVLRTATFTAPLAGNYISLQTSGAASGGVWTKFDNFSFSVSLPVNELTFWADPQDNGTTLVQWACDATAEMVRFEVEKSTDGIEFLSIGEGTYEGIDQGLRKYFFSDRKTATEPVYYQLKMTDASGNVHRSQTIRVFPPNSMENLMVYPSVASDRITLWLESSEIRGEWEVEIFSADGKVCYSEKGNETLANKEIAVDQLAPGYYLLRLKVNGIPSQKKFVVAR